MANRKREELRKQLHDKVDALIDETEDVTERGKNAIESIQAKMQESKQKIYDTRDKIDNYVQEKPEQSMLIAAGVGIALGSILTAAMMRKRRRN